MASAPPDTVMQAVALGYKPGMPAPRVLAQGRGELAQALLDRAKALGIPTRTEPSLVAFLMELDLNAWVPPELFAAVAQVLAWAYEIKQAAASDELPLPEIGALPDLETKTVS